MNVKVIVSGDKVLVSSPFSDSFVRKAKQLGGKWNSAKKVWEFDIREESVVREHLREIYGTDGTPVTTADVHVSLDELPGLGDELKIGGRTVLKKWDRDRAPTLGNGCVVISGGLLARGGSRKYPMIRYEEGTVIEVREVPAPLATRLAEELPDVYRIIMRDDGQDDTLTADEEALVSSLTALDDNRLDLVLDRLNEIRSV